MVDANGDVEASGCSESEKMLANALVSAPDPYRIPLFSNPSCGMTNVDGVNAGVITFSEKLKSAPSKVSPLPLTWFKAAGLVWMITGTPVGNPIPFNPLTIRRYVCTTLPVKI